MELAISLITNKLGYTPSAKELGNLLGGDPSGWGRILKGQCKPSGEYHAKLKRVMEVGIEDAVFEMQVANTNDKYTWKNRKGRIIPHTDNIFFDVEHFCADQIVSKKMVKMQFENFGEEFLFYSDQIDIYTNGVKTIADCIEECALRRDFIESLS